MQQNFGRYALYGEGNFAIPPEFLHIEPISLRSSRYEWTIAPHTHPGIFQILLVERGGGECTLDQVHVRLQAPTLVTVPSGCVHSFAFDHDAEGWVLSIAANLLGELRASGQMHDAQQPAQIVGTAVLGLAPRLARRMSWLLREIAEDLSEGWAGRPPESTRLSLGLLLAIGREIQLEGDKPSNVPVGTEARHEQLVQRFRALVDLRFRDGWSVPRYATELGASVPTLGRACHLVLGRSPSVVIQDRTLLEAMRSLTYSSASVSRIGQDLGFEDPAYFARFFKVRTGMTASQFRNTRAWFAAS